MARDGSARAQANFEVRARVRARVVKKCGEHECTHCEHEYPFKYYPQTTLRIYHLLSSKSITEMSFILATRFGRVIIPV